jgi:hypothetical protein
VILWLLRNLRGRGCFLNDCTPGASPFETCFRDESIAVGIDLDGVAAARRARKDFLLFNFEDADLAEVFTPAFRQSRDTLVGTSARRLNVLVLRDPFNNLASLLRWARGRRCRPRHETLERSVALWKQHAREYLGLTETLPDHRVLVSFNRWFADAGYRDELGRLLSFSEPASALTEVARWGPTIWGDSFDGLSYDERAQEMRVLERFRHYADDSQFLGLLDEEACELAAAAFEELPGIEPVVAAVRRRARRPSALRPAGEQRLGDG